MDVSDLLQLRNETVDEKYESYVVSLATSIISSTEKVFKNGYRTLTEYPLRDYEDGNVTRADVIIKVRKGNRVVLVIECKVEEEDFEIGEIQLEGYMIDLRCGNGILMNATNVRTYSYKVGSKQKPHQVSELKIDSENGIKEIIDYINRI
ncbi:hypothetical protein CONCODRAFT_72675 [Conidiobolus coronatus NRRL 28638]|uniref:Type I restriction enzyme R protein N-terminal domain-containing protein n=1 Tax=Conidiobolus coronatus (strain ATCC 28846 / CBS 209.66 / NRRL 28638) TaxID=796925 RepID=A0A137NYA9_CONC2|nr:hypothetical protein CONCODRAFT_72675 [Conidiobolus coronatus NRRL 28638]|eukprot:KXN67850.1 hypothetical protein CONCODRAFT_72675 [Conidiobolus coronatus NRRL 28638]